MTFAPRAKFYVASPIPLLAPVMNQLRDHIRSSSSAVKRALTGDVVQLLNHVIGQLQVSAGYILSQMLNR